MIHISPQFFCKHVRSPGFPLCAASEAGSSDVYRPPRPRLTILFQSLRKYSAEAAPKAAESTPPPPPPKKSNLTPIYVAVGLAGLGAGIYRYSSTAEAEPKERTKIFNGQDWVDLKVGAIETLSHNTKKIRFVFDDKEAIGGLPVAC